ncbi:MAG TPA: hypothetical protein VNX68_06335 [Nitrosopumilaceae archaeon]|jgi:hypothetical protein|nr:hypothetical protein [Nitrosopumilaceae archaeon]
MICQICREQGKESKFTSFKDMNLHIRKEHPVSVHDHARLHRISHDKQQEMVDNGIDTWDEYDGEK